MRVIAAFLCLSGVIAVDACSSSKKAAPATSAVVDPAASQEASLVGKWTRTFSIGSTPAVANMEFRADRSVSAAIVMSDRTLSNTATWSTSDKKVRFSNQNCAVLMNNGTQTACTTQLADMSFEVNGDTLVMFNILADGGTEPPRTYTRVK